MHVSKKKKEYQWLLPSNRVVKEGLLGEVTLKLRPERMRMNQAFWKAGPKVGNRYRF